MASDSYKEASLIARKRRYASIAAFFKTEGLGETDTPNNLTDFALNSGYYTTDELEIIQSEAEDILQKIRDQIWTSLEVAQAFCKASAYAQELTNCITEVLFSEAFERAKYLDDFLSKNGTTVGPLHGLPISLKDCFVTAPHPSSIGIAAYANEPTTTNTLLVDILRDLGAVFYVKTNVPVAMMMPETINNVWGETVNPLHKGLSPGGSSGGEGALIAFRASPLGVGTDIGGSVRIPAGWCHLYGLKPSAGRFPVKGSKSAIMGQEFVLASSGPMSKSLSTVKLYCQTLLSEKTAPWNLDHKCLPLPWRMDVLQPPGRKLRLALIDISDGLVTCHPPVERALRITKTALEGSGHEIIPWSIEAHETIVKNLVAAFFDLGGTSIGPLLESFQEPVFPSMQGYALAAKATLTATEMKQMVVKRNQIQQAYLDQWNASATPEKPPIDGIIMAVAPWAAPRLGQTQTNVYIGYTGVWNFLDFAACTFPVTFADKTIDKPRDLRTFKQLSDIDGRIQADYDADFYHGAPVSLQLIGKRLEEEKVLEMVEIVAEALKNVT